jgi:Fe-S cluster assembly scaffold protein SufB
MKDSRKRQIAAETEFKLIIIRPQNGAEILKKKIVLSQSYRKERYILLYKDGNDSVIDLEVRLVAKGSAVEIVMPLIGKGSSKSQIRVSVIHDAPDTYSRVLFKAALWDNASINMIGSVRINKKAVKSDAYLSAHARMMSKKALAKLEPQLEVFEDNIKASHGSTVGSFSEKELFYLRSKGLSRQQAERILINGYFEDIYRLIPVKAASELKREI